LACIGIMGSPPPVAAIGPPAPLIGGMTDCCGGCAADAREVDACGADDGALPVNAFNFDARETFAAALMCFMK
jgi:hypothetical protein